MLREEARGTRQVPTATGLKLYIAFSPLKRKFFCFSVSCGPTYQEQQLDYLSEPYLLSMPQTAWETGRPAHPSKRPHLMPVFPLLEETKYYPHDQGDTIDPELRELCQPLHQLYCVRDRQEVIVSYMIYRRAGPLAFKCLREWVHESKKRR